MREKTEGIRRQDPHPADARGAEREARRTALLFARTRAIQDLQTACDRRHRASLERTIEDLDAELGRL